MNMLLQHKNIVLLLGIITDKVSFSCGRIGDSTLFNQTKKQLNFGRLLMKEELVGLLNISERGGVVILRLIQNR